MDLGAKQLPVEVDNNLHLAEEASCTQEEVASSNNLVRSMGPYVEEAGSSSYCSLEAEAYSQLLLEDLLDADGSDHLHFLHDDDLHRFLHDVRLLKVVDLSFRQHN